jgi:phosphotransferase system  glucose/maltose/N-acetylglucosamine-specific IIC component
VFINTMATVNRIDVMFFVVSMLSTVYPLVLVNTANKTRRNIGADFSRTEDRLLIPTFVLVLFSVFTLLFFNPLQIALSSPDRLGYLNSLFVAALFRRN